MFVPSIEQYRKLDEKGRWEMIEGLSYQPQGGVQLSSLSGRPVPYDPTKDSAVSMNSELTAFYREALQFENNPEIVAEIQSKMRAGAPHLKGVSA